MIAHSHITVRGRAAFFASIDSRVRLPSRLRLAPLASVRAARRLVVVAMRAVDGESAALLAVDVETADASFARQTRERRRRSLIGAVGCSTACVAIGAAFALSRAASRGDGSELSSRMMSSLGAASGWLATTRAGDGGRGGAAARLGVDAKAAPRPSELNVDAWLGDPTPVYETERAFTSDSGASTWALMIGDERDLWRVPVCKRGAGYRLGNAVLRSGRGWLQMRARTLNEPDKYQNTLLYAFLAAGAEGPRAFASMLVARERERQFLARSELGATLSKSVVMPMRLSDKVRFVEANEKLILDAVLDYRRARCPDTCEKFIVAVSLVWGGDVVDGGGQFAYKDHEYKESIRILRSMLESAKEKFPPGFELTFAVTSDADDAMTLLAYAPHLMSNPLDSASTLIELAVQTNNRVNAEGGVQHLLEYYDRTLAPRRHDAATLTRAKETLKRVIDVVDDAQQTAETNRNKMFAPDWFRTISRTMRWPDDAELSMLESLDHSKLIDALTVNRPRPSARAPRAPEVVVLSHDRTGDGDHRRRV